MRLVIAKSGMELDRRDAYPTTGRNSDFGVRAKYTFHVQTGSEPAFRFRCRDMVARNCGLAALSCFDILPAFSTID